MWRPLIDSVEDWPLAVCDGRTVDGSDLVETDHVRRQYSGSTLYMMHNPAQRFYYMSKQSKNEVLIFKNFDSKPDVEAKCKYNRPASRPPLSCVFFSFLCRLLYLSTSIVPEKTPPTQKRAFILSPLFSNQSYVNTDAPHASFLHPHATVNTPPRESIEVRAFVFTVSS